MLFKKKKALVISDFDGTICKVDMGSEVLCRFTKTSWNDLEGKYIKGSMGSRAAYEKISPLMEANREDMRKFVLAKGKLTRGFLPFYRLCKNKGLDMKILSDGLDFYIQCILENKGLGDIEFYSNVAEFDDHNSVTIKFPEMNALCGRCGTCKNSILNSFRLQYEQIIYIGDGHSDWCPSRAADLVFAKGVLLAQYRRENIPCIPFDDFSIINQYLKNHY
ncbi:MAG: MtnX-like HAD-IB family phosphatase [Smithellaceae bacterium]